jgi:hypothetical protein
MMHLRELPQVAFTAYFLLWGYAVGISLLFLLIWLLIPKAGVVTVIITAAKDQFISWMTDWRIISIGVVLFGISLVIGS